MRGKRFWLLAGLLAGTVLAAPAWAQDEPVRGGTLLVGLADDPPELDPHLTSSNASRTVLHNIFATLVEIDEELQVVPGIAHSWDISEDGKNFTFHIHEGVTFHDGTPLDAEAVKYNFDRMRDTEFGSAHRPERNRTPCRAGGRDWTAPPPRGAAGPRGR